MNGKEDLWKDAEHQLKELDLDLDGEGTHDQWEAAAHNTVRRRKKKEEDERRTVSSRNMRGMRVHARTHAYFFSSSCVHKLTTR
mmetsp:Transcript_2341/g.5486  ORF Transcript_2341/g.5486 Transcript_2341/m.5486 type:complete len:84 (-) Transcript_2341:248-499(-)